MATEKFHHTTAAGVSITLPRFDQIPSGVVRKVRKESPVEQMFSILETVCDAATLAKIDKLTSGELQTVMSAWQEDAKVTAGESKASSDS